MDIAQTNLAALAAIKQRAFEHRISSQELCALSGVGYTTLWRSEKYPERIRVSTLRRLEQALDKLDEAKVNRHPHAA